MLASRPAESRTGTSGRRRPAEPDSYLTDGARLFRVIAPLDPDAGIQDAVLEDCATLAWRLYSATDLAWLPLHAVIPAEAASP